MVYQFDDRHERGSSHRPTLERYRRMLNAYRAAAARKKAAAAITIGATGSILTTYARRSPRPASDSW